MLLSRRLRAEATSSFVLYLIFNNLMGKKIDARKKWSCKWSEAFNEALPVIKSIYQKFGPFKLYFLFNYPIKDETPYQLLIKPIKIVLVKSSCQKWKLTMEIYCLDLS